jgi:hypothetical protein
MVGDADGFGDGGKELRSGMCTMAFVCIYADKLALAPIEGEYRQVHQVVGPQTIARHCGGSGVRGPAA